MVYWYIKCPYCGIELRLAEQPKPGVRTEARCPNMRRGPEHDHVDFRDPHGPSGPEHPYSTTQLLRRTGRTTWPYSGNCGRKFYIKIREFK